MSEINDDIKNKDYVNVDKEYNKTHDSEFIITNSLNKTMPLSWVRAGLMFQVRCGDQMGKFDAYLYKITLDRRRLIILRIELEFGTYQDGIWDFDIPKVKWYRGLSLLKRKHYDICNLFIKMSPTTNSLFLVDCENNFVFDKHDGIDKTSLEKMGYITNRDCYYFNWDTVMANQFIINEKNEIIQNGNIFLVELGNSTIQEERRKMYEFIKYRFFPESLKNDIKNYE